MNSPDGSCPICCGQEYKPVSEKLLKCKSCGVIFNNAWAPMAYSEEYFIQEYTAQYGKTYIDDFDNIYALSQRRLDIISENLPLEPGLSLLDIGSAAGFFLKAAMDRGIKDLAGVEISAYASSYCMEHFGIKVYNSPFDRAGINRKFNIITAWFFLEHCQDPLFSLEKISGLMEEGGILALSLPSWFGPLYYFHRDEWIRSHPSDHRIDLSPGSVKKMLQGAGFKTLKVKKCGYHPERVIKKEALLMPLLETLYRKFTDLTAFSDTIEVYAIKQTK